MEFQPISDDVADLVNTDLLILDDESSARTKWQILMEQGSTTTVLLPPNLKEGALVACLEWLEDESGVTEVFVAVCDKDKAFQKNLHFLGFTDAPVENPVFKMLLTENISQSF